MAMAHAEFNKLSKTELQTLCNESIQTIQAALPYDKTKKILSNIQDNVPLKRKESLRGCTLTLFKVVEYCSSHRSAKGELVPVEANIVNNMLRQIIS